MPDRRTEIGKLGSGVELNQMRKLESNSTPGLEELGARRDTINTLNHLPTAVRVNNSPWRCHRRETLGPPMLPPIRTGTGCGIRAKPLGNFGGEVGQDFSAENVDLPPILKSWLRHCMLLTNRRGVAGIFEGKRLIH